MTPSTLPANLALASYLTLLGIQPAGGDLAEPIAGIFSNFGQVVLALLYMIGTIVNNYFAGKREQRQRAWLVEDRRILEIATQQNADKVRRELIESERHLVAKIDESTKSSNAAYHEANNMNSKIAGIAGMRREVPGYRRLEDEPDLPTDLPPEARKILVEMRARHRTEAAAAAITAAALARKQEAAAIEKAQQDEDEKE